MIVPRIAGYLEARAPREDVEYLRSYAGMILTGTVAVAAIVYVARGGNLVKLAPAP